MTLVCCVVLLCALTCVAGQPRALSCPGKAVIFHPGSPNEYLFLNLLIHQARESTTSTVVHVARDGIVSRVFQPKSSTVQVALVDLRASFASYEELLSTSELSLLLLSPVSSDREMDMIFNLNGQDSQVPSGASLRTLMMSRLLSSVVGGVLLESQIEKLMIVLQESLCWTPMDILYLTPRFVPQQASNSPSDSHKQLFSLFERTFQGQISRIDVFDTKVMLHLSALKSFQEQCAQAPESHLSCKYVIRDPSFVTGLPREASDPRVTHRIRVTLEG
jgi:hypothetical protein